MTMLAPVCKTATIRKLKRSHAELECQEALSINPSRPILRSASVVRMKRLQPSVSQTLYQSYTDDQPDKLIFNRGQLKLVVCGSENQLAVTVLEARSIQANSPGTTMVLEAHLLPAQVEMAQVSDPLPPNAANINKTFTFDINERLQSGTKLFIRVYLQKGDAEPKFVGCMSFGARKIIQEMSIIKGWYYLLSENLGRRKHLAVSKSPHTYPTGHNAQKLAIRKPVQSVCDWSNSTSSSSAFSSIVAGDVKGDRRVRWNDNHMIPLPLCSTPKSPRRIPSPLFEEGFSLHGQDISVHTEQVEIKELTIRRGWCGFGFTLVGESPAKVESVFEECVAAQVGVKSGDSIISVNGLAVAEQNAARVSEAILKTVSDLHLEIEREISTTGSSKFSKQRAQETQSPRKIQKFNLSDDEELENNVTNMEESKPEGRLGGIDNLLKFDEGLKPLRLLTDGRDFVYSGAVFASISGMAQPQRVWIILLTDMMIITEYDSVEQRYVIIEEPVRLRHVTLDYEAFSPDGTPDLTWKISVMEGKGFGPRKYTFKADTAELSAMWKCSISRQIDLARRCPAETNDRTPSRCRSEADMNRVDAYDVATDSLPRGTSSKNRRKSFGPARIDLAFVKLVSGARETIRNRRRNSTTNALEIPRFSPFQESAKSFDEQQEDEYFTLKSSSSTTNLAGKNASRKSQLQAERNYLSKHASSSNLDQMNTSGDSGDSGPLSSERKSLPEKVNFAATWVSAKLLKKHRERKARRLESEANLQENGTSALDRLVESDLIAIRLGLADTISNEATLSAFREFLEKEHSEENLCFWLACEDYKNFEELRDEKASQILEQFILSGAEQEINIDSETKRLAISGLEASPPAAFCLVKAQEHVFKLMQTDTYMRFLRTLPPLPQSTPTSSTVNQ